MAYVETATDTVEATTFITPVRQAVQGMAELSQRLDALANRLVGAAPPSNTAAGGGGTKLASVPSSVFDKVADMGNQMNGDISFAFEALNRIERSLP